MFGFAGPLHEEDSDNEGASSDEHSRRRRHLQIAGPVFLSVSVATCLVAGVYGRLVKWDWLQRQVEMELEHRGGPVRALAFDIIRQRVSPMLLHDPDLQRILLSRLHRQSTATRQL